MIVLQLDKDCYYLAPMAFYGKFRTVGVPYLATEFSEIRTSMIPTEVLKVFKGAKFVRVKVQFEIEDLNV